MKLEKLSQHAVIALFIAAAVSCGQDGQFIGKGDRFSLNSDNENNRGLGSTDPSISEAKGSGDAVAADAEEAPIDDVIRDVPEETPTDSVSTEAPPETVPADTGTADTGTADTGTTQPGPVVDPVKGYEIPGAKADEMDSLNKCLSAFTADTFPRKITNFKRMTAQIIIGGTATPIDDQLSTAEPQLILIEAAANYNSNVTYNMLNRNGYYCMDLNVNVDTILTINLHCHAQVADSAVSVEVGSATNGSPSAIGVHVNSEVRVQDVRPAGEACIR